MLWNNDQPRARAGADEVSEISGRRPVVVSHQNPPIAGRKRQNLRIVEPSETSRCGSPEVDLLVTPNDRTDDGLIEVGICLKSNRHQRARGVCFFASASFW
jgi:hypothetical protein